MTTFLFWNINKKPLASQIINIVGAYDVDVVILVESQLAKTGRFLREINTKLRPGYALLPNRNCEKIEIYTRFATNRFQAREESDRYTIEKINFPVAEGVLLAALHFPSKVNWSETSQMFEAVDYAERIRAVEKQENISRTVVVGDFNMNP
ncbi:conserved hypothetical protein [Chloroherpeton thalassium ATCC 35110]|uniref:Endonuclease/exonuclease/phosphatase n=1 Tax=Chloroherpeton thalassium (strain ATCC 35110 / GB-78) TaxID=517418 RepID=B3QT45_CHLT3|nr:endonuclease/exonuclease/phosphatase family protein [Chloroherpeton thalassium]ACF14144.1 conserved hypothetical protein [Chloroherpeton thalassium ATCC 35110]